MTRRVVVVTHTHWDREWHLPFEAFRARLAAVLDGLLAQLDADPEFGPFLLDGQVAAVDDYLAVRPAAAESIQKYVGAGRLAVGPWYTLMDEFCVSGETIVRNLEFGRGRADELGGAMPVGYLPDMFGHVAQMPQLLRLAGFDHAVVWRGVPAAVDRTAFWWRAPDGSRVRAEYLPVGYANGAFLPQEPGDLVRRVAAHADELDGLLHGPLLLMNGTDHHAPQAHLSTLLAAANDLQDDFDFTPASLTDYLGSAPTDDLPEWSGELRSGARANLLMGVLSNRVDIKVSAARAERALERLAEPLATLWLPSELWPSPELDRAWLDMIRNSAHDSICGCSADEVGRAVLHRYDGAVAAANEVIGRALSIATVATPMRGPLVVNPGPAAASGVVEVVVAGIDPPAGTQVLSISPEAIEERVVFGRDLGSVLGSLSADGWLVGGRPTAATVTAGPSGVELDLVVDASQPPVVEAAPVMAEAWAQAGAHRDQPLRIRVQRRATQRVLARMADVPGYGWAPWSPAAIDPVEAGPTWLDAGLVRVEVDPSGGTFSLNGLAGFDRLVDGGDDGDTYNYAAPAAGAVVDTPASVAISVVERGPVRGRLRVLRTYAWRDGPPVVVETMLEVRAGEPLVRITTSFDNTCRDHRLRAHFPLPAPASSTEAECAFGVVRRDRHPEGGPQEPALATYPSRRWVRAGGLTVTHEGLLEHELISDDELAITLLRATGILSRPTSAGRQNQAGPALPLDGPQLLGPHRVRYAVAVGDHDPWRLADLAWLPLQVVDSDGSGGPLPASGSRLRVSGAEVAALRRVDGAIELRVFNPTAAPTTVLLPDHAGWLVDLAGAELSRWDGSFGLRPWGIATARLDARSLDG